MIRICGDYTTSLEPFFTFSPELKNTIKGPFKYIKGKNNSLKKNFAI